ncbi:hypothetical protein BX666DRAFT_705228 [Dichotomocladium elegans]|nr:hypothetical protein BX666DRAFT_705228 [Dichotomocladium elegans]
MRVPILFFLSPTLFVAGGGNPLTPLSANFSFTLLSKFPPWLTIILFFSAFRWLVHFGFVKVAKVGIQNLIIVIFSLYEPKKNQRGSYLYPSFSLWRPTNDLEKTDAKIDASRTMGKNSRDHLSKRRSFWNDVIGILNRQ